MGVFRRTQKDIVSKKPEQKTKGEIKRKLDEIKRDMGKISQDCKDAKHAMAE